MSRIDNCDDIIDLRAVMDRIEELEEEYATEGPSDSDEVFAPVSTWSADDRAEWESLRALIAECESVIGDDLRDTPILVRESYWTDYARDWYADTWGGPWIKRNQYGNPEYDQVNAHYVSVTWDEVMDTEPFGFIDWQRAADHLRRNQAEIEWEGVTYIVG